MRHDGNRVWSVLLALALLALAYTIAREYNRRGKYVTLSEEQFMNVYHHGFISGYKSSIEMKGNIHRTAEAHAAMPMVTPEHMTADGGRIIKLWNLRWQMDSVNMRNRYFKK